MNAAAPLPADTKTRILDAAERVFSQDGFDGASLRTITAAAQVNLAAVNYHFHSKEALFSAVVERRVRPINLRRLELLDAISGKPTVEKIIESFVRPPLEVPDASEIRTLMARLYSVPSDLYKKVIEENFGKVRERFVAALAAALPDAPREELQWGFFLVVGAMAQAMAWSPYIMTLVKDKPNPSAFEDLTARIVCFCAAGLKANSKRVNH